MRQNVISKSNTIYFASHLGAIKQIRIHWMLDLLQIQTNVSTANGHAPELPMEIDFSSLDRLIYQLYKYNLRPGFEIMGNPGGQTR
jgi:hypothetical protein